MKMAPWIIWFALAGVLVVLEMFSGTFYLLMIAISFAVGGVVALAGTGGEAQLAIAAMTGLIAIYGLRRSRLGRFSRRDAARDPNVNLDIGQTLTVDEWSGQEGEIRTARAVYRGASWDIELEPGAQARPGVFVIREIRGNRLVVGNAVLHHR